MEGSHAAAAESPAAAPGRGPRRRRLPALWHCDDTPFGRWECAARFPVNNIYVRSGGGGGGVGGDEFGTGMGTEAGTEARAGAGPWVGAGATASRRSFL